MSGVFISYRRDDQAGFAGRLADVLVSTFGADNVFRDIEDIHPGEDFVVAIEQQLAAVDVMLVMIGPAWLTVSRNGLRRLDEPDDFVRREIEAGLKSGKAVLPVLVGGAAMPAEKDLPPASRRWPGVSPSFFRISGGRRMWRGWSTSSNPTSRPAVVLEGVPGCFGGWLPWP